MLCRIYTDAGQFVLEGPCGIRRDGDLEVIPLRARRPLRAGEAPLLVVEGPRRYPVRVTAVHDVPHTGSTTQDAVYQLTPMPAR